MTASGLCPTEGPEESSNSTPSPPETNQSTSSSGLLGGETGDLIGDYVLGETIGSGTFGKVKLGVHLLTGEKVAIKILEKKKIIQVADVERVAREIKILKRNRHLHVIQLYQVIDSSERIYLIMEHVDGGELFEYIVAQHRMREIEAVVCFQQIVEGLAYLHAHSITHRDLKPENVLLSTTKYGTFPYLVKIVDFGLSNTHEDGRLLRTACGSPCYAAPEMIQGKLYKGPMADIWSLGVVLFAMVCGYLPFEDSNTNILYKKILSADYKLPSFLSHTVQDLLQRILETNPEKRFTIDMIRQHPWFNSITPHIPRPLNEGCGDEAQRELILSQLVRLGLDRQTVLGALQQKMHNRFTASYYLLYNKLVRHKEPESQTVFVRRPEVPKELVPIKAPSTVLVVADPTKHRVIANETSVSSTREATRPTPFVPPSHTSARRPASQRTGRHLVLLPASTTNQPHPPTVVPTRPPSQSSSRGGSARTNGLLSLTPLLLTTATARRPMKPFTPKQTPHPPPSSSSMMVVEASNNRKRINSFKENDIRPPIETIT